MSPFKKIILIVLLSLALAFMLGKLADKGYHRFWRPFFDKLDVTFRDSSNYDVLYLGNSTVHFGINPYYVDSVTKLNTYNLGYGGANIETMSMLLHGYMEKHPKPKAVLLSMDHSSFWPHGDFGNHFLYFNYLQNKYAEKYLQEKGYRTWTVKALPFLKYSYFDDYNRGNIITGFGGSPFEKNAYIYKGFINNRNDSIQLVQMNMDRPKFLSPDKKNIALFYQLLDFCKAENIQAILVFPPRFYEFPKDRFFKGSSITDSLIANTAVRYQLPYKRYDEPDLFGQNEFTDRIHLNKTGSQRFSIMLAGYIDSCININK